MYVAVIGLLSGHKLASGLATVLYSRCIMDRVHVDESECVVALHTYKEPSVSIRC